jgi:hypothetical protein
MQPREETTFEHEQDRIPGVIPHPGQHEQARPGADIETQGQTLESEAYSAEEQALVEERLRNLGYL